MAWLKLIRWQNLLIIMLTQLLAWWCVILPEHNAHGNTSLLLTPLNFCFLSAATILIAASGYIINDYFDVKIDTINRPGKVILGKAIPRKTAIIWHTVLNAIALLLAGYVAARAHHYEWLLLQLGCTLLLWFYSTHFKRQYISGNVVVALLTALTILVLVVYEPVMHQHLHLRLLQPLPAGTPPSFPLWILVIYSCFAFLLTWMREIVKDMEDLKGDEAEGCVTMPIRLGLKAASRFTVFLACLAIAPLLLAATALYINHHTVLAIYTLLCLSLPLIAWAIHLPSKADTQHYARASRGLKIIMIAGVCSLVIYHFQLQ